MNTIRTSLGAMPGMWVLIREKDGRQMRQGDVVVSHKQEIYDLMGGTPPHKPSSTGRVYVVNGDSGIARDFFPGVFGLKWARE